MTMTPDEFGWAALPWMIGIAFMWCAIIWALIVDDGKRADRRRHAEQAMACFDWTRHRRFAPGRSTLATDTMVIPKAFLPEPLEPGPDSPLTTVEPGEVESDPLVEQPEPAPSGRVWPVPQLLPQPKPEPAEAVLYHATGQFPTYPEWVDHTGMTGVLPKFEDYMPAGAR